MLAFSVLCLLLGTDPHVTVSTYGAKIENVLKDVSAQTGVKLTANPSVRGEIVVVQAQDVPLQDLMDRIAHAEQAEWHGNELTRSHRAVLDQTAEENRRRTEFLRKSLAEKVHPSASDPAADPSTRMVWSAIERLGPEALAAMPSGIRVVWSSTPNRLQRRLPFAPAPLIQTYVEGLRKAKQDDGVQRTEAATEIEVGGQYNPLSGYLFSVSVRDSGGNSLASGAVMYTPDGPNSVMAPLQTAPPRSGEVPLKLTRNAQSTRTLIRNLVNGRLTPRSPEFDEAVFHPEQVDPLALFPSDVTTALAKRHSRTLVAVLPDCSLWTGILFGSDSIYADETEKWLANMCQVDETYPGWMVVRPIFPVEARTMRANRETMGAFFRRAARSGISLTDFADYTATQPRCFFETESFIYAFLCAPELLHMCEARNIGGLRTYGALTPQQRLVLEHRGAIPLMDMSPIARAELSEWVYNTSVYEMLGGITEATDVLPDGIPLTATLTMRVASDAEVVPLHDGLEDVDTSPMSATALGYELVREANGETRFKGKMNGFWLGQRRTVNLYLTTARSTYSATLNEHRINRKGSPLTLATLPADFRKAVEDARKTATESRSFRPPATPAKP